jgi:hypothetical protein
MPDLVEREEGLFTRHGALRALCCVVLFGWAGIVPIVVFFVWAAINPDAVILLGSGWLINAFALVMLANLAIFTLWLWRHCDRCRRRLFSDVGAMGLLGLQSRSVFRWFGGTDIPERDYRAKTLLGSYRNHAIVRMAFTGRLSCQWCGHEDGAKPDYVVVSHE